MKTHRKVGPGGTVPKGNYTIKGKDNSVIFSGNITGKIVL